MKRFFTVIIYIVFLFPNGVSADVWEDIIKITCIPEAEYFKIETISKEYHDINWLYPPDENKELAKVLWEKYGLLAHTNNKPVLHECKMGPKKIISEVKIEDSPDGNRLGRYPIGFLKLYFEGYESKKMVIYDGTIIDGCYFCAKLRSIEYDGNHIAIEGIASGNAETTYESPHFINSYWVYDITQGKHDNIFPITNEKIYEGAFTQYKEAARECEKNLAREMKENFSCTMERHYLRGELEKIKQNTKPKRDGVSKSR